MELLTYAATKPNPQLYVIDEVGLIRVFEGSISQQLYLPLLDPLLDFKELHSLTLTQEIQHDKSRNLKGQNIQEKNIEKVIYPDPMSNNQNPKSPPQT